MIFSMLNAGCGYDLINDEGWLNVDTEMRGPAENFRLWDITEAPNNPKLEHDLTESFEFILLNHVLLCFNDYQMHQALINLHRALKPGGTLLVIDMDLNKVIKAYQEMRTGDIPIDEGSIDFRFCNAISGYGSRKAVFTVNYMIECLEKAGFRLTETVEKSYHDSRPKESLIIMATK